MGFEGVLRHRPKSILFDTMGNAFVYPAFSLVSGAKIVAYTHYPFISEEMVKRVVERRTSYNNAKGITNSILGSSLKVAYYNLLKWTYSVVGRLAWRAMANSTWTFNHLRKVWPSTQIDLVYPPCDVEPFLVRESTNTRTRTIVSLAQFRPEKNHRLQLESFGLIAKRFPDLRLILIGGCRDASDEQRVKELTQLAVEMGISGQVTFKVNVSFSQIVKHLQTSLIGLHTMIDEHFGISIVEFMAAGLVTVAHRSGGPKSDIIDEQANGFLAESPAEYANIIEQILLMPNQELEKIRNAAKGKATSHFSLEKFAAALNDIYVQ